MKKVLFIDTLDSPIHAPVEKALKDLGFEIYFIDYRGNPILFTKSILHKLAKRLPGITRKWAFAWADWTINNRILKTAQKIKPDYIFAMKAKNIEVEVIDKLRAIAPTVNWYADIMDNWETWQKVVTHYDYMFNYDNYLIKLLRDQGHNHVYHLPWAGYISKDSVWPGVKEPKYNIVFIGSYDPVRFPREEILKPLKSLGLHIWGNKAWLNTSLKDCYQGHLKPHQDEFDRVYKNAKIALYLDSLFGVTGTGITLRPFEITSAGAMMLGQVFREEFFSLFKDGEEVISFKENDEMLEKVTYYLKHDDERRKIAKAGFERTRSEHTYYDRLKKMFEIIDSDPLNRYKNRLQA